MTLSEKRSLISALCHSVPEIHHSDQGVQYLSKEPISQHSKNIALRFPSHSADGLGRTDMLKDSYARAKSEEVYINDYQNIIEARDRIGHFITQVYNQKRPHSALGYLTPMEFQRQTLS